MAPYQEPYGGVLRGTEAVLYVDEISLPEVSAKAQELLRGARSEYDLKELRVIELNGEPFGETLPYLVTRIGSFRGISEIQYFTEFASRLRAAFSPM